MPLGWSVLLRANISEGTHRTQEFTTVSGRWAGGFSGFGISECMAVLFQWKRLVQRSSCSAELCKAGAAVIRSTKQPEMEVFD